MAIAQDEVFVTTPIYVFEFDLTSWGWIHLILGVTVAALLVLANFLSLPYNPVWSIVAIAFYAFVIWALCVVRRDDSMTTGTPRRP